MIGRLRLAMILMVSFTLPLAALILAQQATKDPKSAAPARPQGPCDVYADDDCPCAAAHSTTRALYASYNGPLYQVMRQSDGETLDIGVVQPNASPVPDPGGYADAAAQDKFCADTVCWITKLYDQSGNENHLTQAPRGFFSGPAMGGFNNLPIADMAPVTIMGHKVYGIFIEPGMGLRWNDAKGTAVDDQAEGQYWVINGHHYNSGCCFDYGNGETDSRDDGDGTMETTYYGNAGAWYRGQPPGPWIMTDQENNLVGCVNPDPRDKFCADLPSITWRFVTATADGEPHHWRTMGGDAQQGDLQVMFDGPRIKNDRNSYDPMRKQGAVLLGNGGDNSNASQGTFYEAAMTAPGTFPSNEANQRIQANIVAAKYDVAPVTIAPASANDTPPGLQTFSPGSSQETTVAFTNTTGSAADNVELAVTTPEGWTATLKGTSDASKKFSDSVAPGEVVRATFTVTSGKSGFNGDLIGVATWKQASNGQDRREIAAEKVRNVSPIKINEFAIGTGSPENSTNSFIELFNSGSSPVDISGWTLTEHATQQPIFSTIDIPAGTTLSAGEFYLFGLSHSGLATSARAGDETLYLRSTTGMSVGDTIEIGEGSSKELRKIASVGSAAGAEPSRRRFFGGSGERGPTTLWQPLPDGPVVTVPVGSNNVPVTSVEGFEVGQKMGIGYGAEYPAVAHAIERYEVVTITEVGKPGTQAWLAGDAKAGDTNIKVSSVENITAGDKIRLDIDSVGHGIETVKVKSVGTAASRRPFDGPMPEEFQGTGLELETPLKFEHSANMPFSVRGTGISFEPATQFEHSSNEPVLPLGTGVTLDRPLEQDHEINAVVRDRNVTDAGYQGSSEPDQRFGGPALSSQGGTMVLRNDNGLVVDSLNYGGLIDPWAAEGYQAASGAGANGCSVRTPDAGGRGFGRFAPGGDSANISAGRYPDGADTDSNCEDFLLQTSTSLVLAASADDESIKVSSVANLAEGQELIVGMGENQEAVRIASVGTAGGTKLAADAEVGSTTLSIANAAGFETGQAITIGSEESREKVIIASIDRGRFRGFGRPGGGPRPITVNIAAPLQNAYSEGDEVSGSGIRLSTSLNKAHAAGAPVATSMPTPGKPNVYFRNVD
ncbi:lamin tail domain-containing protein [Aeoliella sp. ICT_H6.2]|uniref:Lamin tail domain-containing protein n=1 Tax=Aeoliella straminimaris TaxID=2954799 RepID=A0A9X2F811_9BACT|nr:arabinofuranosidase catalytic domain-containing protein [Aeoliella straminimaris]MCO6044045.1 lamin tail domain-containing protein [Aeoliella straminimaris]